MKTGTKIRFKVANYNAGKRIEETGEVADGTVIRREGNGFVIRVEGHELPFYATHDDIIEEGDGEE